MVREDANYGRKANLCTHNTCLHVLVKIRPVVWDRPSIHLAWCLFSNNDRKRGVTATAQGNMEPSKKLNPPGEIVSSEK